MGLHVQNIIAFPFILNNFAEKGWNSSGLYSGTPDG